MCFQCATRPPYALQVVILDFGLMTEVTEDQRIALVEYISHLMVEDWEGVAADLVKLGEWQSHAFIFFTQRRFLGVAGGGREGEPAVTSRTACSALYLLGFAVASCGVRQLGACMPRQRMPWTPGDQPPTHVHIMHRRLLPRGHRAAP